MKTRNIKALENLETRNKTNNQVEIWFHNENSDIYENKATGQILNNQQLEENYKNNLNIIIVKFVNSKKPVNNPTASN